MLLAVLGFHVGILHLNTTNEFTTKQGIGTLPSYNKARHYALPAIIHAEIRDENEIMEIIQAITRKLTLSYQSFSSRLVRFVFCYTLR